MITTASVNFYEALESGDAARAHDIEVEIDTLFRIIAIIDGL